MLKHHVLVRWKIPSKITDPKHWVVMIIWGSTEQSRRNWIKKFLELPRASVARDKTIGRLVLCHKEINMHHSLPGCAQQSLVFAPLYSYVIDSSLPYFYSNVSISILSGLACWIALVSSYRHEKRYRRSDAVWGNIWGLRKFLSFYHVFHPLLSH